METKHQCPFCESDDITIKDRKERSICFYFAFCEDCEASGPPRSTYEKALLSWNNWITKNYNIKKDKKKNFLLNIFS